MVTNSVTLQVTCDMPRFLSVKKASVDIPFAKAHKLSPSESVVMGYFATYYALAKKDSNMTHPRQKRLVRFVYAHVLRDLEGLFNHKQSIVRILRSLEEKTLIERYSDVRESYFSLTPKSMEYLL